MGMTWTDGRQMNLRQLQYLVAAAEELNFTAAAARCHVSQPPFSRAISDLEAEVGARLFNRTTHSVSLTAAGEWLVRDVRRALALIGDAAEQAGRLGAGLQGTIKIGFGGSAVYALMPEMIRRVRVAIPDVSIEFVSLAVLDQIEALRTGAIDLGVLRLPVHDELIETRFVYEEPLIVALPDNHPLAGSGSTVRLSQLAGNAFVTYQPRRGFNYHLDLLALCRLAGFSPDIRHEAATTEAVIGIVACGEGVALVPASANRLRMRGVEFRRLTVKGAKPQTPKVDFGLAWHRERPSQLIREFVRLATDHTAMTSLTVQPDEPARAG